MASTHPKRPGKLTMLILLALFLVFFGAIKVSCATLPDNSTDVLWLQAFRHEISADPSGWFNSWNSSSDHCLWSGVRCSRLHPGRVVALELSGLNLAGQISSSIGNLTFLRTLNLSTNSFSGQLPTLNHLQKLQVLDLSMNQLHDSIPDAIVNCSKLRIIDLSKNFLVGEIPPKIGVLSNLSVLRLSWNNLTGAIPPNLGNITSLEKLGLAYNSLTGSIPDDLGKLTNVWRLVLGGNRLSGGFPHSLFNLSGSLIVLGLESNMLSNELPHNIGDCLPNLQELYLNNNKFQGQVPTSLGNASELERLELETNNLTGEITSSLGKLSNLYYLNLEQNNLEASGSQSWEFFNALTNCTSLETLSLAANQLHGAIPDTIGNFSSNLNYMLLGGNKLSGTVPRSVGNLGSLFSLGLEYNNLTGNIEEWIENLTKLQALNLQMNNFIGPLPSSLGQLTQLTELNLGNNKFEGLIPPTLENIQRLSLLNLSCNNLQGNIPIQVGSLTTLVTLDLSSNKLTGEIPHTLAKCQNIDTIQMAQNFLVGTIPTFLGMLLTLSVLNLSLNNLSGAIPAALNGLQLSELDLSYNHLQGEIPETGVFENATSIYLDGNWGLCGGVADLHMPLCPAVSRRSKTEYYLVRALIPFFGFMSLVMLAYIIIMGKKTSRRTNLFLLSFGKKFPRVSYKDLNQATGNFSQAKLLGRGSYGSVYRGKLTQAKIQVAIKVFDLDMKFADKSFVTECDVLRSIRHRNLLPILTACSTIDNNGDAFKALIYEFMPNGNLDTWLHGKFAGGSSKCLSLAQRASIAVGIADALAYLHHDCERQIVHCDLKPTNILLDDDMNAYLGDFGIASLVGHSSSNTSVGLKGTIGYIAPEYAQSGQASIHGDVYSFGIVLLEMLIGKRPTDPMFENEVNLVSFAKRNYPDQTLHIIDARLQGECESYIQANITMENAVYGCLLSLMQVALSCTHLIPIERMNIREVTNKLHSISTSYIRATKRQQVMLD